MAVKTITIDMEAYGVLAEEKRGDESFSRVIKRRLRPAATARTLLSASCNWALSEEALGRVEEVVRARAESPAASPRTDGGG